MPERCSQLGPEQRRAALARRADDVFDIVVVGGGMTGCGSALDAAARVLSVARVEQRDYASGTSSRSSKLIHGGLRYVEQRDFGLVREALRERSLLLKQLCPHLVHPVPFLFPLSHLWERAYIGAGVLLYDTVGGARAVPMHRHLTRRQALELAPALRPDALVGPSIITTRRSTTRATPSPSPAPRRRTRLRSPAARVSSISCASAIEWQASECATWNRATRSTSAPAS